MKAIISFVLSYILLFNSTFSFAKEHHCKQIIEEIQKAQSSIDEEETKDILEIIRLAEKGMKEHGIEFGPLNKAAMVLEENKTKLFKSKFFITLYSDVLRNLGVTTKKELESHFLSTKAYDYYEIEKLANKIYKTIDNALTDNFNSVASGKDSYKKAKELGISAEEFVNIAIEWKKLKENEQTQEALHITLLSVLAPTKEMKSKIKNNFKSIKLNLKPNIKVNFELFKDSGKYIDKNLFKIASGICFLIILSGVIVLEMEKKEIERRSQEENAPWERYRAKLIKAYNKNYGNFQERSDYFSESKMEAHLLKLAKNHLKEFSLKDERWKRVESINNLKDQFKNKFKGKVVVFVSKWSDTVTTSYGVAGEVVTDYGNKNYQIKVFDGDNTFDKWTIDNIQDFYYLDADLESFK